MEIWGSYEIAFIAMMWDCIILLALYFVFLISGSFWRINWLVFIIEWGAYLSLGITLYILMCR
jgi:hypothetical protein